MQSLSILAQWTSEYAVHRYGKQDAHADRAWQILLKTAYGYRAGGRHREDGRA